MFLQSRKPPIGNRYQRFFAPNYLDNEAENQSFLCAEIMRRRLVRENSNTV